MARTGSCHFESVSRQAETVSYGEWQELVLATFKASRDRLNDQVIGGGKNLFLPFSIGKNTFMPDSKRHYKVVMVVVMVMVMVFVMVMVMVFVMGMAMIMVGYWQDPVLAIL